MCSFLPKLPVLEVAHAWYDTLREQGVAVLTAPPGAGKSTLLPLLVLEDMKRRGEEGKIVMLEPRRLAAKAVAERMASLLGEPVGEQVGYRVRMESRVSERTRIEVLTEGLFTRLMLDNPLLEGIAVVLFDEVHERSLHADLALALVRETKRLVRPELRLGLMSATIDAELFCRNLQAPLLKSEGRMFPVEVLHEEREEDELAPFLSQVLMRHEGDVLVFLSGEAPIRRLAEKLDGKLPSTLICPLYGQLSMEAQHRALRPAPEGMRKVVLATSIAETSLTIEGVRVVVDSGWCKRPVYDARTGFSRLERVRISLDMADQRSGRAGRVAPGVCYRMWSLATEHRMEPTRKPEIEEADLSSAMLQVAAWGEQDMRRLPWLTPPRQHALLAARTLLLQLGAVEVQGEGVKLLPKGRRMLTFPVHPRLASMLLRAGQREEKWLAAALTALLEERDPLPNHPSASLEERLWRMKQFPRLKQTAEQVAHLMHVSPMWERMDTRALGRLLTAAYPERVGRSMGGGRYQLASGERVALQESDALAAEPWLVVASMSPSSVGDGRIFLASPVEETDLTEWISFRTLIRWDGKQGTMVARRERRIGSIVLQTEPLAESPSLKQEVMQAVAEAAPKDGLSMFDWNDDVQALQQRIAFLSARHPDYAFPDCRTEAVLACAGEWLPLYVGQYSLYQLKRWPMADIILSLLSYEQQQLLQTLAPAFITLPGGKRGRLEYRIGQETPVLRVRLQDCFGMLDTPRVDGGTCPVLMELLSPGFKPVQLTSDLRSFWQTTYFEVRKELRRRYPKHPWPEDPLNV